MIKLRNYPSFKIGRYPDGSLLLKLPPDPEVPLRPFDRMHLKWFFDGDDELAAICYLKKHLDRLGYSQIDLVMPYIPNARQDRVKNPEDVFTLKYFAEVINSLGFDQVITLDPHSSVSEALIDRIQAQRPYRFIEKTLESIGNNDITMFYPDEGAMKRYSDMFDKPFAFGIKKRDWKTGRILDLQVQGEKEWIDGHDILIVDDICSYGGTFIAAYKALKALGAKKVYLFVSHCEKSVLKGDLLESGIEKLFTTNSIFRDAEHEKIEVFEF